MLGGRHLPSTQEASENGGLTSHSGLLTWWQRRSWRMDLAVLARVRDGLKRLDEELDFDGPTRLPPAGTGGAAHTGGATDMAGTSEMADTAAVPRIADTAGTAAEEPSAPPAGADAGNAGADAGNAGADAGNAGADAGNAAASPADPTARDAPAGVLPDAAIMSIRETFAIVAAAGEEPAGYFYGRLFIAHPQLRDMFPPAMDVQRDRLLKALVRIVEGLTSPEDLVMYLSQLGRDHRKYSVAPEMYDAVGQALIATLRAFAGPAFTPAAEEAWVQAYQAASGLMIRAAEDNGAVAPAYWTAEVVSNEERQPGISVLTVAPDQPLPYLAGQHVTIQTSRWPRVWRAYSVASRPREDGLMTFHVRAVPGGWVSNALVRYSAPGDELILGPALGTMTLDRAGQRDLLCVAGGTGLSPIKAIIEQAIRESSACPRQIFLFYGARTREELYDLQDLYRLVDAYPQFMLTPVTSDDPAFDGMQGNVGRVAARYLPHSACEAYVAGPPQMVRETIRVLARAGIPQERIHYDDALLAEDKRLGPRPPQRETEKAAAKETGDTGNASARDTAAERTPRDANARRSDGPRSSRRSDGPRSRRAAGAGHQVHRVLVPEEAGLEDAIGVGPVKHGRGAGADGRVDP
jgi:NAD(P)H-flavin reductase/hemoglobin-like flavoprotein